MFYEEKFVMIKILILLQFLLAHNDFLVEASIKSGKARVSEQDNEILREQSSKQISVKEEAKPKSEDEQVYYLPMQTVFGSTHTLVGSAGVSTTSPPHLAINPAPIQAVHQESTHILHEDVSDKYYSGPYQSQCVSETPVIELQSRFLLPSSDVLKESVIMSGHLEIASKTSSVEAASEINNIVSKPSIALQGTLLHSHATTDL